MKQEINYNQFPNFLIVGANKGGTTSLYKYCNEHPEILMSSIKEPMFFTAKYSKSENAAKENGDNKKTLSQRLNKPRFVTSLTDYQDLFVGKSDAKVRGEASTAYLGGYKAVIPKVRLMYPEMKFIACLRHPLERAFSAHSMYYDAGLEKKSFEECLLQEMGESIYQGRQYLLHSLYYEPILNYIQSFGRDNVLVLFFDDLKKDSVNVTRKIFSFLQVDTSFIPDTTRRFNTAKDRKTEKKSVDDVVGKDTLNTCINLLQNDVEKLKDIVDFGDVFWKF